MSLKVWSHFVDFCIYVIEQRLLYDALVISTIINRLDTRDKDRVIDDIGMRLAIENPEAYRWFFLEVALPAIAAARAMLLGGYLQESNERRSPRTGLGSALSSSPEERAAIAEKLNLDRRAVTPGCPIQAQCRGADIQKTFGYHEA